MLEREVEKKLVQGVKRLGGLCLKWVSPGYSGVPDRIVLLPGGRVCFVELKTDIGRLSARQKYVHKCFKKLGFSVYTLKGMDEVKEFLDEAKMVQDIISIFYDKAFCKRSYGEIGEELNTLET